jgi:hypothetical protein
MRTGGVNVAGSGNTTTLSHNYSMTGSPCSPVLHISVHFRTGDSPALHPSLLHYFFREIAGALPFHYSRKQRKKGYMGVTPAFFSNLGHA